MGLHCQRGIRPNLFSWSHHALYERMFYGSFDVNNGQCVGTKSDCGWHEEGGARLPGRRSRSFQRVWGSQQVRSEVPGLHHGFRLLKS